MAEEYPCIEVSGRGYKAFLDAHPRRPHLRRGELKNLSRPFFFVYDLEAFEADRFHAKSPSYHLVAYRSPDENGTMRYFIFPFGRGPR